MNGDPRAGEGPGHQYDNKVGKRFRQGHVSGHRGGHGPSVVENLKSGYAQYGGIVVRWVGYSGYGK